MWMKRTDGMRVKSADLVHAVWRGVVGLNNGTINLTKPRRNAVHRIASYISKYISKGVEDAVFNKKSYWSSKGIPKPEIYKIWLPKHTETWDIVSLSGQEFISRGLTDINQYANTFRDFHWFAAGKP